MGCWQETCALTSIPIFQDEKCVMVVLDEEWTKRIQKHESIVGLMGSSWQWRPFRSFHKGTYNDYGWINELDMPDEPPPCIFFHLQAWNWVLGLPEDPMFTNRRQWEREENDLAIACLKGPLAKKADESPEDHLWSMGLLAITPEFVEFQRVCDVAGELRKDIFAGLKFRGCQENLDWETRQNFWELQHKILDRQKPDEFG
jgi:hypothetical protein